MTQKGLIEFLRNNPEATNSQIVDHFGTSDSIARTVIYKLKRKGVLELDTSKSVRHFKVLAMEEENGIDYKRRILRDMCDTYYDDFLSAELYSERVEIGKMICRILEKI